MSESRLYCNVCAAIGAALREFWRRPGPGSALGEPDSSIRDFAVVATLGHGDYGSVFEVGQGTEGWVLGVDCFVCPLLVCVRVVLFLHQGRDKLAGFCCPWIRSCSPARGSHTPPPPSP